MGLAQKSMEDCETVPLTEDERAMLRLIYSSRRKLLVVVYAVMVPLAMLFSREIDYRTKYTHKLVKWESYDKVDRAGLSRSEMIIVNNLCLTLPVIISGILLYRKRVGCVKKDLEANLKYRVLEEVAFKQYFPHTDQYFISLNDANYLHHEVDAATFQQVAVGDKFPIYFACHSKYAFNKNGSFAII